MKTSTSCSTILAISLLLGGCAGGSLDLFQSGSPASKTANLPQNSSFCQSLQRTIRSPADSAAIKSLARTAPNVAKRVATNDSNYRCQCEQWDNPICKVAQ